MSSGEVAGASPEIEHLCWRQRRHAELAAPSSWLGLVGLYWLEAGCNRIGSAPGSAVPLPGGPSLLGELCWQGDAPVWRPATGVEASVVGGEAVADGHRLRTDAAGEGNASRVRWGDLEFFVIERDGRAAVRLRDLAWHRRRPFAGVEYYPFDPGWRIEADWQEMAAPVCIEVPNASGELKPVTVRHRAVFAVAGEEYALLPLEVGDRGIFFVFRDATSGRETYGGGRFLHAEPAAAGRLRLDFNRAYNPPCAFTPFATCPLPPPENWLRLPIRAGERKYSGNY